MCSIFLGAGFSKWAANIPLANSLFDFKIDTGRLSNADFGRLQLIEKDWTDWRVVNLDVPAEQFIYWSINKSSHRRSRVIWYISRRLSEPFITRISGSYATLMIDDRRAREHEGSVRAREFLSKVMGYGLNGIITCNYDMLVEFTLGTGGFNYGVYGEYLAGRGYNPQFPWQNCPVYAMGRLPLAKLHGSLSWDIKNKYTDGKPGRTGSALLVPPVPEKIAPDSLNDVWDLAEGILRDSKEIIVFGFAFNPYDEALLNFFAINGAHLKRVLLVDPFPKKAVARKLWPKAKIDAVSNIDEIIVAVDLWLRR